MDLYLLSEKGSMLLDRGVPIGGSSDWELFSAHLDLGVLQVLDFGPASMEDLLNELGGVWNLVEDYQVGEREIKQSVRRLFESGYVERG